MLRPWKLELAIDPDAAAPRYQQVVEALIQEIRKGRLKPGTPLPGSRQLAEELGVNRKTVANAYFELTAQGWLESRPRSGTFVSDKIPENLPQYFTADKPGKAFLEKPHFPFASTAERAFIPAEVPGLITFDDGFPDVRLAPVKPLGIAYRRVMEMKGRRNMMGYSSALGLPELRKKIAKMLNETRGLTTTPDNICITRGSQMGLYLVSRVLTGKGDLVAMETLSYTPAQDLFNRAGATIVSVPLDEHGLRVDLLEKILKRQKIRAVFLTPHHQYPTTVTLKADRRMRLLQLARQYRFAIIEDDYDHEYHYSFQIKLPALLSPFPSLL